MAQLNSLLTDSDLLKLSESRYRKLVKAFEEQNTMLVKAQLENIKLRSDNLVLQQTIKKVIPNEAG